MRPCFACPKAMAIMTAKARLTRVCIFARPRMKCRSKLLHSDNGTPMKGATVLATLRRIGVVPLFSRLSTSNYKLFSEAPFKTLKHQRDFPDQLFDSLDKARRGPLGSSIGTTRSTATARSNSLPQHNAVAVKMPPC